MHRMIEVEPLSLVKRRSLVDLRRSQDEPIKPNVIGRHGKINAGQKIRRRGNVWVPLKDRGSRSKAMTFGFWRNELVPRKAKVLNTTSRQKALVVGKPEAWTVDVEVLGMKGQPKRKRFKRWFLENIHLLRPKRSRR